MEKKPVGRPRTVLDGKITTVLLDQHCLEIAERLGGGSVSAGIRIALKNVAEPNSDLNRRDIKQ